MNSKSNYLTFNFLDENSWLVKNFREEIKDNELNKILNECFGLVENVEIDVLAPGFSGSFVLRIDYVYSNTKLEESSVIKICKIENKTKAKQLQENENNSAKLFSKYKIDTNIFYGAYLNTTVILSNSEAYYCLLFNTAKNKISLINFLYKKVVVDKDISEVEDVINNLFANYNHCDWKIVVKKSKIYRGGSLGTPDYFYSGLSLKSQIQLIRQSIHRIKQNFGKRLKTIGLDDQKLNQIEDFVETHKFNSRLIDGKLEKVPLSIVHGDLNGSNILVNKENGLNAVFIDFAHMNDISNKHTLLDFGRISVEMEKGVIPDYMFFNNKGIDIELWVQKHKSWLTNLSNNKGNEKVISSLNPNGLINRIYFINGLIRYKALERCEKLGIYGEDAIRQFYFVRLHFLFKCLIWEDVNDFKRLFFIKACYDLLEFLSKPNIIKNQGDNYESENKEKGLQENPIKSFGRRKQ